VPTQVILKRFSGTSQTAVAGSTASVVFSWWTNADGWVATVEATIVAVGVSTEQVDAYYRREVFKWTDGAATAASVGILVEDTVLEEDAAWDAHVVRNGNNVELHCAGDAAEKVNFAWSGTVKLQKVS
jgi:hypothetical protein